MVLILLLLFTSVYHETLLIIGIYHFNLSLILANSNPDEEQKSSMLQAITLLPTCPVLKHVDVVGALDHCLTHQMPVMAALLLPFIEISLIPLWQEVLLSVC